MLTIEDIERFEQDIMEARKPKPTVAQMVDDFATVMKQKPNKTLSAGLIDEEYKEWEEVSAYGLLNSEGDIAELKELADLVYVIYGYARVRGWDLDEAIRRVHQNNLDRCIQPDGTIKYRDDGKVMKRDNPPKVDLSDLV